LALSNEHLYARDAGRGRVTQRGNPCPRTATLAFTEDRLSQLHIALDARIEALERIAGEEPDAAVGRELMGMLRRLDHDITEPRRAL
jgi:hypothetical protein